MKYYAVVRQTGVGLWVPRRLLHSINVRDQTVCYAVRGRYHFIKATGEYPEQVIISPIPRRSWGCTCLLTIRIQDETGSLKELLALLESEGINVWSSQVGPAGLTHAAVHIWGEVQDLRDEANCIRKGLNLSDEAAYRLAIQDYSRKMIKRLASVERKLIDQGSHILYTQDLFAKDVFGELSLVNDDEVRIHRRFKMKNVIVRWIRNLAINFFYGTYKEAPKLQYNASMGALTPKDPEQDSHFFNDGNKVYVAAFDPSNAYVRLRGIESKQVHEACYEYELRIANKDLPTLGTLGTRGLMKELLEEVGDDTNFGYVKSVSGRVGQFHEKGTFTLAATSGGFDKRSQTGAEKRLQGKVVREYKRSAGELFQDGDVSLELERIRHSMTGPFRIFLSMHTDLRNKLEDPKKDYISLLERNTGVELLIPWAHPDENISDHVLQYFDRAHAFMQVLSLTDSEAESYRRGGGLRDTLDLTWLAAEWAIAKHAKMRCCRLVDTSHIPEDDWGKIIKIHKDTKPVPCDLSEMDKLIETITTELRTLAGRIEV